MMTDHAEFIGLATMGIDPKSPVYKTALGKDLQNPDKMKGGAEFLFALQASISSGMRDLIELAFLTVSYCYTTV